MSLRSLISDTIRREGPIPFSRYMAMCLYEPGLGYYARPREQFGKAGDFYTSSDVHALFGRLLCRQFEQMWRTLGSPSQLDIIELGPGRGLFALDVLDWADKKFSSDSSCPTLPAQRKGGGVPSSTTDSRDNDPGCPTLSEAKGGNPDTDFSSALHYHLVETSAYLRDRQAERLSSHIQRGRVSIHSDRESAAPVSGEAVIIFGNEFFDALPVDIIDHRGELRVALDPTGHFHETFVPPSPEALAFIDQNSVPPQEGERIEVALIAQDWMRCIAAILEKRRGYCLFIDYGYTREEQLAGRHLDTVMTYREHTASPDPYQAPGDQDITAHVNFTALRNQAEAAGLRYDVLVTQAEFLMGIGETNDFSDAFDDCRLPQERAKVALQLKHLVTPAGIGEIFQVLVLSHNVPADRVRALHGLKLAR
jgi:SAM-dependent MidA family methyltransferase